MPSKQLGYAVKEEQVLVHAVPHAAAAAAGSWVEAASRTLLEASQSTDQQEAQSLCLKAAFQVQAGLGVSSGDHSAFLQAWVACMAAAQAAARGDEKEAHSGDGGAELVARAVVAAARSAYAVESNVKTPQPLRVAARLQARAWGELALSMLSLRHQQEDPVLDLDPDAELDLGSFRELRAWPLELSRMYEGQSWGEGHGACARGRDAWGGVVHAADLRFACCIEWIAPRSCKRSASRHHRLLLLPVDVQVRG